MLTAATAGAPSSFCLSCLIASPFVNLSVHVSCISPCVCRHASHKGHGVPVVVVAPGDVAKDGESAGWQCKDLRRLADHVAFVCNAVV